MSDSDEFFDVSSETSSEHFSINGPKSAVTDGKSEEFYDVIENEISSATGLEKNLHGSFVGDIQNSKTASKESLNSIKSENLSIFEFLQEEPEPLDSEQDIAEKHPNKRETIYEFLASDDSLEKSEEPKESESSLSRLQSELKEEEEEGDKFPDTPEHDNLRKSILNLPSTSPPPLPHRRDSFLMKANPLATFFSTNETNDSDSDSMISELTEAMTIRTEISDLRLSRHASMLNTDTGDYVKISKRYKPVPVKIKAKQKSEFSSMFLIQELNRKTSSTLQRVSSVASDESAASQAKDPSKAIFVLKFSPDGQFLAAAGAEGIIKIWSLLQVDSDGPPLRLATIFENNPIQILKGHTAEILDCAWSSNNFLLSASMDKTVRLWHHSRTDALGIFQHLDYVTSVAFHPRDPRIFLSGSLDCKLRLWSIQDRTILHWNELPPGNFITAVAFTRSGTTAIAGTSGGAALIFDTEGLRYNTQILVRSSRSKSFGKKITSIESVPGNYDNDERILISSNDSRIRMYSLRDKNVIYKYKGHENVSSQIGASLSTDADFILSGSEDCRVYLWRSDGKFQKKGFFSSFRKDHIDSYESFKAHSNPVTAAIIAPNGVTNLLQSLQLRPLNPFHPTEGKIIITADVTGQIKVFENNSKLIEWLK